MSANLLKKVFINGKLKYMQKHDYDLMIEKQRLPPIKHTYGIKARIEELKPIIEPPPQPVIKPEIHPDIHLDIKKDYYSCVCGSIIKNTDTTINKHKTTKLHNNYINKYNYKDISWDNIKSNNIYIINVDRYIDRYFQSKNLLKNEGFKNIKKVVAYDGFKYKTGPEQYEQRDIFLNKYNLKCSTIYPKNTVKADFWYGALGCAISHYELLKYAYDNNLPYIFVLEDDIHLDDNFKYADELWQNTNKDFDILFLNVESRPTQQQTLYTCQYNKNVMVCKTPTFGGQSYIITRNGIKKYFDFINENGIYVNDIDFKTMSEKNKWIYYNWVSLEEDNLKNPGLRYGDSFISQNMKLANSMHNHRPQDYINKLEGWCCDEKKSDLYYYINEYKCKSGLEIGVFGGSSLIPIGLSIKSNCGHVVGIDTYQFYDYIDGNKNNDDIENTNWWRNVDYKNIKQSCMNAISRYNLIDHLDLIQISSDEYSKIVEDDSLDFLHIDGSHTETQAYNDVINYIPKCKKGCIIFLDDICWEGVCKARNYLKDNCKTLKETIRNHGKDAWGIYQF